MKTRFMLLPALAVAVSLMSHPVLAQGGNRPTVPTTTPVAIPPGVVVGVVDEDILARGYKEYASAVDALDALAGDLDGKIAAREFLSGPEATEFDALINKLAAGTPALNPTEKSRLDELVKSGLDKRAEYTMLIGKAVRSEEDAKRMKVLSDVMAANQPSVRTLSGELVRTMRDRNNALEKQYTDSANSVIGQVAAEKKLVVIMRKGALIWWASAIDITDDVLKRLNPT